MCPGVLASNNSNEGACPNLTSISSSSWPWSSYPINVNTVLAVNTHLGSISTTLLRNNATAYPAFCK